VRRILDTGLVTLFLESSVSLLSSSGRERTKLSSRDDGKYDAFKLRLISLLFIFPLFVDMLVPIALALVYKKLILLPPKGSVVVDACRVGKIAALKRNWNAAKPSVIEETLPLEKRPNHYDQWDDEFIGELRTTLSVCKVSRGLLST